MPVFCILENLSQPLFIPSFNMEAQQDGGAPASDDVNSAPENEHTGHCSSSSGASVTAVKKECVMPESLFEKLRRGESPDLPPVPFWIGVYGFCTCMIPFVFFFYRFFGISVFSFEFFAPMFFVSMLLLVFGSTFPRTGWFTSVFSVSLFSATCVLMAVAFSADVNTCQKHWVNGSYYCFRDPGYCRTNKCPELFILHSCPSFLNGNKEIISVLFMFVVMPFVFGLSYHLAYLSRPKQD